MYFRRISDDPADDEPAKALGVKDALEENDADSPAVDDDAAAVAARHAREDILSSSALNAAALPPPPRAEYQADSEGSPGDGLAPRRAGRPPQWVDCTDSGGEGYAPECDSELDMPGARRGGLSHIASMRGMWEQADSMEAQLEEAVSSSLQAAVAAARTAGQSHGRSSTAHRGELRAMDMDVNATREASAQLIQDAQKRHMALAGQVSEYEAALDQADKEADGLKARLSAESAAASSAREEAAELRAALAEGEGRSAALEAARATLAAAVEAKEEELRASRAEGEAGSAALASAHAEVARLAAARAGEVEARSLAVLRTDAELASLTDDLRRAEAAGHRLAGERDQWEQLAAELEAAQQQARRGEGGGPRPRRRGEALSCGRGEGRPRRC
ncbi:hypothetical protein EMIHUDRAFT_453908 [Emiliania huxleyi CCMP1516]|uniref:Uncharacterized protein n=2 Tax=Emiliania huxleyi TaxID=2903 RepID=A0A0D3HZI5_EMIH1|nr:hypothetical protein EMIHUDRAFT_453908 [Emiliania huxleyi CCMP1516]EOD04420.1 hypothetical protein EMIHUDRAFT_453908 [Emiliania huxleyi CCMP1516]|eukprot:XP_005756849.1 hypothetical protein EMIHUDRAFT_453908 [Emiliania huxleyi CCMP1516]